MYQQGQQQQEQQRQQAAQLPTPAGGSLLLSCPHFASCSGCTLEAGLDRPPILEEARQFFEAQCGLPSFHLSAGPAQRWRHRARLVVRRAAQDPSRVVVGLFAEGSHTAVDIPSCV